MSDEKRRDLNQELAAMHQDLLVTMQSALIEWIHGRGAEAALQWIVNTLDGPGLLPDPDAPWGRDAQRWMDANRSDPLPVCKCGTPSHIAWMGQGFCCEEHYREAKAKSLN